MTEERLQELESVGWFNNETGQRECERHELIVLELCQEIRRLQSERKWVKFWDKMRPIKLRIIESVADEHERATSKFPRFASAHEGYAVLLEEVDELWDEIKSKGASKERMREEAIQVAAMALRFIIDCTEGE